MKAQIICQMNCVNENKACESHIDQFSSLFPLYFHIRTNCFFPQGSVQIQVRSMSSSCSIICDFSFFWCVCMLSHVRLFAASNSACQDPLSVEFSTGQEYWSRLPFPAPGDRSQPGIEPRVSYVGRWILYH